MADLAYAYTNSESNRMTTVPGKASYTPYIGTLVYIDSSGDATVVTATTQRPWFTMDTSPNGSDYTLTLMDSGTFNSNETTDFYEGVPYYSDGDGTMSTVAITTGAIGWIVGYAVSAKKFIVDISPVI